MTKRLSVAFFLLKNAVAFNRYSECCCSLHFQSLRHNIFGYFESCIQCLNVCFYKWLNWRRILNANDGAVATVVAATAAVVNAVTVTFPIQIAGDVNAWMQQIWLLFRIQLAVCFCCYICILCEKGNFNQASKKKEKIRKEKERSERTHLMVYFRFVCQLSFVPSPYLSFTQSFIYSVLFYKFVEYMHLFVFPSRFECFFYLNRCWICSP